jgi:hypothetical protein
MNRRKNDFPGRLDTCINSLAVGVAAGTAAYLSEEAVAFGAVGGAFGFFMSAALFSLRLKGRR